MANKQQTNWPMRIAGVLLCLVLATTSMVSGFYAKFAARVSGQDTARAAALTFRADGLEKVLELSKIKKPGDKQDFSFTISSENTEVETGYTVKIQELGSLPLKCTLNNTSKDADGTLMKLLDDSGTFQAGSQEATNTYTLTVEWPADKNEPQYAGGVAAVSILVTSEQVD